ncbi:hypothetical protein MRX96_051031 [Rhipicephalus microplus]
MDTGKIKALGDALQMNQKYGCSYMVTLQKLLDKRFDYYFHRCLIDLTQDGFHQCPFNHSYKLHKTSYMTRLATTRCNRMSGLSSRS